METIVDRWIGRGAADEAWHACHTAAAALKTAHLTGRYGVKVTKGRLAPPRSKRTLGRSRGHTEYRLCLVDRNPTAGPPDYIRLAHVFGVRDITSLFAAHHVAA